LIYILPLTVCVYLHSNFSGGRHKTFLFLKEGRFHGPPFNVIQGRWIWHQSKAHMRLPISP